MTSFARSTLASVLVLAAACTPSGSSSNAGASASTTTPAASASAPAPSASASASTAPAAGSASAVASAAPAGDAEDGGPKTVPDIEYVPTPANVVEKMLEVAKVGKDDVLYDLGCGDGRIVATAAKKFGIKAKGFDIDPVRVKESRETVKKMGVENLVTIEQKDIFEVDLSPATVVTLYLLPELNVRLVPQLEKLKPGSRIVSHDFDMAGVEPEKWWTVMAPDHRDAKKTREHYVYLWKTPLKKAAPARKK
jgi:SAM-dependent methyltransferase